jgi:hypothetical protein
MEYSCVLPGKEKSKIAVSHASSRRHRLSLTVLHVEKPLNLLKCGQFLG